MINILLTVTYINFIISFVLYEYEREKRFYKYFTISMALNLGASLLVILRQLFNIV